MIRFSEILVAEKSPGFDLLADDGNDFAARLGLRLTELEDLKAISLKFGIDLVKHNDGPSWALPRSARIVIYKEGVVRSVGVDTSYKQRPEPEAVLDGIKAACY